MHHVRTEARARGQGIEGGALKVRDGPISWGLGVQTLAWQEEAPIREGGGML